MLRQPTADCRVNADSVPTVAVTTLQRKGWHDLKAMVFVVGSKVRLRYPNAK